MKYLRLAITILLALVPSALSLIASRLFRLLKQPCPWDPTTAPVTIYPSFLRVRA
jgi:hypothetical protein